MKQVRIPAVFMRGGTSNAIVFHQRDLPEDRALWDEIFLAAMGSPDPLGRQLNGMGGGISSLSKVCVIGPPSRPDADFDYTFAQVSVRDASVHYGSNCGNMSSAMGPFAVDEGLMPVSGDKAMVRIHNTNTNKVIHTHFDLDDGQAVIEGGFEMPGVIGGGAPVRLEFRDPGGAGTGKLLPTGNVIDTIDVPGLGKLEASLIDAANACVFVEAAAVGLEGNELPADIDARADVMAKLESIRCSAGVMMGYANTPEAVKRVQSVPKVGFVAPPKDAHTLSGEAISAAAGDLTGRMVSMGNTHRALPLTGASCMSVAARIEGSVVYRCTRPTNDPTAELTIIQPSGLIKLAATVRHEDAGWFAEQVVAYRTQRRLFEGVVLVPASRVPALARTAA